MSSPAKRTYSESVENEYDISTPEYDISTPDLKKRRTGELVDMEATLERMMKSAEEHHEKARTEAIDKASALEDRLEEAEAAHNISKEDLDFAKKDLDKAECMHKKFESHAMFKMLQKASDSKVPVLLDDSEEVKNTLTKLQNMITYLKQRHDVAERLCTEALEKWQGIHKEYKEAEAYVEKISTLVE